MNEKDNLKNFYIFRHGECPFNLSGHIQGQRFNNSLTPAGLLQAARIGAYLSDKKIEVIITSPLRRAIQSAKIVRRSVEVPILVDKRFIEVNMGIIEGMHISAAEKKFPEVYRHWRSTAPEDAATRFEEGETKAEVRKRIFEALNYYARQTSYRNIAVSGHGITISQILLYFNILRSNIPNGSILHLTYLNGEWHYDGLILPDKPKPAK